MCVFEASYQLACKENNDEIVGKRGKDADVRMNEIMHGEDASRCVAIHIANKYDEAHQESVKPF